MQHFLIRTRIGVLLTLTTATVFGVGFFDIEPAVSHAFQGGDKQCYAMKNGDFGDPLPVAAEARIGAAPMRHENYIVSLSMSNDGAILASGASYTSSDHSARVWETKTGKQMLAVDDRGAYVALSPDGNTLMVSGKFAMPSDNAVLSVWNVKSGKENRRIEVKSEPGHFVYGTLASAFSPRGDVIAVESWHKENGNQGPMIRTIRLLNFATGKQIGNLSATETTGPMPTRFVFSPDGRTLAVIGGKETCLHLWETVTGKLRAKMTNVFGLSCVFAPDGKTLALDTRDSIQLLELPTLKLTKQLTGFHKNEFGPGALEFLIPQTHSE